MNLLITGCAGFIGFHVSKKILSVNKKIKIIGIDNLNKYYDVKLKKDRLKILQKYKRFKFIKLDISNYNYMLKLFTNNNIDYIIHLAAQAGVRHSIFKPFDYIRSNLVGFHNLLDLSIKNNVKHFIFASTSSVYGKQILFPSDENHNTDKPLSFYAATKKSNEVMAYSYSNIFKLPITGLRFFTVYGEWGRPDMAIFKFTKAIIENNKIDLFGHGKHFRDFTHVEDVANFVYSIVDNPPKKTVPYEIYNVSSNKPKSLTYFLKIIEKNINKKARINKLKIQKGDVLKTHGSNFKIQNKTKIKVKVKFEEGIKRFIKWYAMYYNEKI